MNKSAIALLSTCLLVACGNSQKQQTADTTVAEAEQSTPADGFQSGILTLQGVRYEFALVEAGTFTMGATSETPGVCTQEMPAHKVTLTHNYQIGKTEVTWGLWKAVMGSYPPQPNDNGDFVEVKEQPAKLPATYLTHIQCQEFIKKLNELTGKSFRLPTEAEWEFAARGGNKSENYLYSGSNTLEEVAWLYDPDQPNHEVATKKPNELGLYDMSGNVAECCSDWWGIYSSDAQTDPAGPSSSKDDYPSRAVRGGNFDEDYCRITYRSGVDEGEIDTPVGFRLVISE